MILRAALGLAALGARGAGALEAVGGTLCDTRDGAVLVREITTSRDATLFQNQAAISSAQDAFMVGATRNGVRRGLLAFDIAAGDFPDDAAVECAEVRLHAAAVVGGDYANWGDVDGSSTGTLHRVTTAWETSGGNVLHGVNGGVAKRGDATWAYSAYPTATWEAAGGDFADPVVATQASGAGSIHAFGDTLRLTRIVQEWIDVASDPFNAGFLLLGDEGAGAGERYVKYSGAESAPDLVPRLIVTYTAPSQGKAHRDFTAYVPEVPDAPPATAVPEAPEVPEAPDGVAVDASVAAQQETGAAASGSAAGLVLGLVFAGGLVLGGAAGCLARRGRGRGTAAGADGREPTAVDARARDDEASVASIS